MDRWKSTARKKLRQGESQKGEDKRWRRSERETVRREKMSQKGEDKRWRKSEREKVRREKMQLREKVGKSRNTVFFICLVVRRVEK